MTSLVSPQLEPLQRWLITPEPLAGAVCIHMGENGWARFQTREITGYEKLKDGVTMYVYSQWQDVIVEAPVTVE